MWLHALHCALGMIFLPDNGCVAVSYYTLPKPNANSAANPSGALQGSADLSFIDAEGATTTKLQKQGMPEGFEDARKSGDEQQDPRTQRTESNRPHAKRSRSRLHRHPRSTANGQEGGAPHFIHIGTPPLRGIKRALAGLVLPLVTGYTSLGIFLYTWGSFELMRYFLEKDLTQVQQLHLNALIYGLRKGKMKAQEQAGHQEKTKGIEGEGGERVHHREVGAQGASEGEEGDRVHSHEPAPQGESEGEERKGAHRHELIA